MGLLSWLGTVYRRGTEAMKEVFIRFLMGLLIFLGYILLSLFIYAILRRIMVPQKLHIRPIHLYFNPSCTRLSGPECPYPQAEFVLNEGNKLLSSGQYYQVALELELPESPVNEDIGVFMVNITFYTVGKTFLSTTARPAMVHYKSPLLHTLSTVTFAPLLLLGWWEQKQVINLVLYDGYYEPYGDGSISATVSLLNHQIQLYSAILTVDANFSGFTYYLYQWPISMSVIVVVAIFVTLCTCTVMMWVRDVIRDYDLQRRRGLQRRRAAAAAQLQQGQPRQPPPVHAHPPPDGGRRAPSEASTDTLAGVEDLTAPSQTSEEDEQPTPLPSTPGDTGSEFSTDFNEVLGSLHSLQRELDDRRSMEDEGREDRSGTHVRQRTGHC